MMKKYRKHGGTPIKIAVLHGGPGGFGGMVNLAVRLSEQYGVLEPFQTENTVFGQVHELKDILKEHISHRILLIGHSWGAWIAYLFAATYPDMVNKVVLVGSGPYEHHYYAMLKECRNKRFTIEDKQQIAELYAMLMDPQVENRREVLMKLGAVFSKIDNVDLLDDEIADVEEIDPEILRVIQPDYFHSLLQEAIEMRKTGALLQYANAITCPVAAIHGSSDPHPYQGVEGPLQKHLSNFTFHLIENCGHKPWMERHGHHEFYHILAHELEHNEP